MPVGNDTFRAISDETRRTILDALVVNPCTVNELHSLVEMSQPAVSQHLKVLREAGLVRVEKMGRSRVYHLEPAALKKVFDWVSHYENLWDQKFQALGAYLDGATS